jgi:hypothetical protein
VDDGLEGLARRALALPPAPPADPDLFTADSDLGPGIYPQGSPMRPARGEPPSEAAAREGLAVLHAGDPGARAAALARFDAPALAVRAPDAGVRAGLAALVGTVAEPALDALAGDPGGPVLAYGRPLGATRIVGPDAAGRRAVNVRYAAEPVGLLPGPLAHEILRLEPPRSSGEEAVLHAVLAMVHLQTLARAPALALGGTELARRLNAFAISLLNSRAPGSARIALVAPDGPGTIPGGAPRMSTPDFWSIPFLPDGTESPPVPPGARAVLARAVRAGSAPPEGLRYDLEGARWLDANLGEAWLPPRARLRVVLALGLLTPEGAAAALGVPPERVAEAAGTAATSSGR